MARRTTSICRFVAVVVVLAQALSYSVPAVAEDSARDLRAENYQQLDAGFQSADQGRFDEALSLLRAAIDEEAFSAHSVEVRRATLHNVVYCAKQLGDFAVAIPYIEMSIELGGPDTPNWLRELILAAEMSEQFRVGLDAVKRLAAYDPEELKTVDVYRLFNLHGDLIGRDPSGELRFEFLRTLYEAGYEPAHPFYTADEFLIDYATVLADLGRTDDLKSIVLSIRDPGILVRIIVDRRFDFLRQDPAVEAFLDLEAAAEREIDRLSTLVSQHPEYAIGPVFLAEALSAVWRFEEALEVIEPAAWKIRTPVLQDGYVDKAFAKPWVLQKYSETLWRLKYPEQSEAMYVEAIEPPKDLDKQNISQLVDMLGKVLYAGHLELVLEIADYMDLEKASPYSRMWVHASIVCANVMGEPISEYSGSEAYLLRYERDNPAALIQSYLCKNDMAKAGRLMVKRLEDPQQRIRALLYLQYTTSDWESERKTHTHETTDGLSPGHIMWHRFDELRGRADVQQAVGRVGRILVIPLHNSSWHRW
ncbi:MAG: hypothetical protein QNJ05_16115 [Woeseiaceae bacterium]|nr:hypothetical protein [Woeseiaceae bacterium]